MKTTVGRIYIGLFVVLSLVISAYTAEVTKDAQPNEPQKNTSSADAKTADGKKTVWTLSTGDTKITFGIDSQDRLAIYELINPTRGWNWTSTAFVIPFPAQAVKESAPAVPITWKFKEALTEKQDTVTLIFACADIPDLFLKSAWWTSSAKLPGPIQHTFLIENKTTSKVSISKPIMDIIVQPKSSTGLSLWTFGDQSGALQKHDLSDGFTKEIASNKGKFSQPMPFALIDDNGTSGLYLGMEDQIDFLISINRLKEGVRIKGQYVTAEAVVPASSTTTLSPTYLGVYDGDLDDGCNQFKRWFWNNKTPANHRNDPIAPWAIFGGLWSYETKASKAAGAVWWSEESTYRKGVEKEGLAAMGFEAVEVDAYWKKAEETGDWPSGTKMMAELAHKNGLKFNLYLMNEVTWDTKEHLKNIWNEYKPDMWRNDFQDTDLNVQAWAQENCPKNYRFNLSCSSCDFKTMTYASIADLYADNPDETRRVFYNLSYMIPPGQINILIHLPYTVWDKGSPKWAWDKDRFVRHFRTTMLAGSWTAVAAITPEYNLPKIVLPSDLPEMIPFVKANLALYKSEIRPLIRDGNLYHNIVSDAGFDGIQYYNPSEDKGVVMLFGPAGKNATIRFKRLKPEQKYQVRFTDQPSQNITRTGTQLMTEGLPVTLTGTSQSEIILIGK
jgi:hypothetical protein